MIEFAPVIWVSAVTVTLVAGLVKGATGFALPLIMVSGLSTIMPPQLAVAGILVPVVVSNALQTFRKGVRPAVEAVRAYWRYVLILCVSIVLFAQAVPHIDPQTFMLVLGIPVLILSLIQLFGVRLFVAPRHRGWAEWVGGVISGALGGLAGTWGPITVLYLMAVDTPKERQVIIQGVIYGTGSVMLFVAHLYSGILNTATAPFSALLAVPALFGMWVGFKIQDRLDQNLFRKATLVVLVIAGLNLIRRGVFG
ncbi:MAG: sulfite exporter TauE/SafE family protein [Pseudomonadota bacterium]